MTGFCWPDDRKSPLGRKGEKVCGDGRLQRRTFLTGQHLLLLGKPSYKTIYQDPVILTHDAGFR